MKTLVAHPNWAGTSSCPFQPSLGAFRRTTAIPLRLFKLQTPILGVTHQSSVPTQTQDDLDAMEAAMRAAKPGNGTSTATRQNSDGNKTPAQLALVEAEALKKEFLKVKEEVSKYKELCDVNQLQKDKIDRLEQEKAELESKVASLLDETQALRNESVQAVEEVSHYKGLVEEKVALESQLAAQRDEQQRLVDLARTEAVEPLKLQLEELSVLVAQREEQLSILVAEHQAELRQAVERAVQEAAEEAAAPLQQQLEELSMQLQNSQAQLERLGKEVEDVEADRSLAIQSLQEERQQLILALEGATRRLANLMYPPGSLPPGMTVSTRLEGNIELDALVAQQDAKAASDAASSVANSTQAETGSSSSSGRGQEQPVVSAVTPHSRVPGPSGFMGWLFEVFRVSLYQVIGALLLYYAASILRGMPPELNGAFFLGCAVVCTLMSWTSHLLFPRFSA